MYVKWYGRIWQHDSFSGEREHWKQAAFWRSKRSRPLTLPSPFLSLNLKARNVFRSCGLVLGVCWATMGQVEGTVARCNGFNGFRLVSSWYHKSWKHLANRRGHHTTSDMMRCFANHNYRKRKLPDPHTNVLRMKVQYVEYVAVTTNLEFSYRYDMVWIFFSVHFAT